MRLRRLSNQIYLTIIVILVIVVVVAGFLWGRSMDRGPVREAFSVASELAGAALPGADRPQSEQAAAIAKLAGKLEIDMALFDRTRQLIASSGEHRVLPPPEWRDRGGFIRRPGGPFAWAIALPDGRWLVAQSRRRRAPQPALRFVFFLGFVALVIGLGAWPVVRGLTRRLEDLQAGVEELGRGDLSARVAVHGNDEIASLAKSFNRSAERIETLVTSHKMLLANASHELRTPLARIRLASELIGGDADPKVRAELEKDIGELDDMIEEILLLSRLDAGHAADVSEPVDLLALAAEEAARYPDCDLDGVPVTLEGNPQLLRRLVRNLLDNAHRHGVPPVAIALTRDGDTARLTVTDHGEGIAAGDNERMFEPFRRGPSRGRSKGAGLGLALVREIAAQHGGQARFAVGIGGRLNRVEVSLPLGRRPASVEPAV